MHIDAQEAGRGREDGAPDLSGNISCGRKTTIFSFFRRPEEVFAASFLNLLFRATAWHH